MPMQVVNGASLACSFGASPSSLAVLPANRRMTSNQPAANIMDHAPLVNIAPFGTCSSPSNPQVAAATAAAMGVLTPQPCLPVIPAPWSPGSPTVMLAQFPALNDTSTCLCAWAGTIAITAPGQTEAQIP